MASPMKSSSGSDDEEAQLSFAELRQRFQHLDTAHQPAPDTATTRRPLSPSWSLPSLPAHTNDRPYVPSSQQTLPQHSYEPHATKSSQVSHNASPFVVSSSGASNSTTPASFHKPQPPIPVSSRQHSTVDIKRTLSSASKKLGTFAHHAAPIKSPQNASDAKYKPPNTYLSAYSPALDSGQSSPGDMGVSSGASSSNGVLPPPRRALPQPRASQATSGPSWMSFSRSRDKELPAEYDDNDEGDDSSVSSDDFDFGASSPSSAQEGEMLAERQTRIDDPPDASRANRRPPHFFPPRSFTVKGSISCIAVHTDTVVTARNDKLRIHRYQNGAWLSTSQHISLGHDRKDIRVTVLIFKPSCGLHSHQEARNGEESGRYVWCGTKDGDLFEFDIAEGSVSAFRANSHTAAVEMIEEVNGSLISVDASGKICVWYPKPFSGSKEGQSVTLLEPPVTQRIAVDKYARPMIFGDELWVAFVSEANVLRSPKIRVYRPFSEDKPFNAISRPACIPEQFGAQSIGMVTCGTMVPSLPDHIFLGHQSGHISIWNRQTYTCLRIQKLATTGVSAMQGLRDGHIWTGSRQGVMQIFDVKAVPWRVLKLWEAHRSLPITHMIADPSSLEHDRLQILSANLEGDVELWDGFLSMDWITDALDARVPEFSSFRKVTSLQLTFNIDAATTTDYESHPLPGLDLLLHDKETPDLIIVGFQELVNLQDTRVVAKSLILGGGRRNKSDVGERLSHQARAWTQRIKSEIRQRAAAAGSAQYELVLQDSLVGLYTAIFVRQPELTNVRDAAIASIKTGLGGRMGNKGAIVASLRIDDTSVAWVNCHLAAGQRHIRQRNTDLTNIFESVLFTERAAHSAKLDAGNPDAVYSDNYAGGGDGAKILPDHEIVFLSGDLNYRVELRRDQCLDLIEAHNIAGLISRDQLRQQLRDNTNHRLRYFHEASISFLPTYKYDRGTEVYDTSDKHRVPAYCDRILWYSRSHRSGSQAVEQNPTAPQEENPCVRCVAYWRGVEVEPSDHRPVMARFSLEVRRSDSVRRKEVLAAVRDAWKKREAHLVKVALSYYFSA